MKLNCGAKRNHYSMFNVGRSMFDVHLSKQPSTFGADQGSAPKSQRYNFINKTKPSPPQGGTMAIIARIVKIFKADIHGVMDQLEDRRLLLKQHLRDMEEVLHHKEAKLRKMTADHNQRQKNLVGYRQQWEALDHDLTVALRKNKDDIARMLIRKMKPLENMCEELTRQLEALNEEMIQFKNHLQQQRLRYEQLKYRTTEYLHKTQRQQWENDVIDPVFVDGYEALNDEEIELELLKRKEALEAHRESVPN
jgi:phage shock protein A